eukprot:20310-Heterocapsa_arctica.AAC.1
MQYPQPVLAAALELGLSPRSPLPCPSLMFLSEPCGEGTLQGPTELPDLSPGAREKTLPTVPFPTFLHARGRTPNQL